MKAYEKVERSETYPSHQRDQKGRISALAETGRDETLLLIKTLPRDVIVSNHSFFISTNSPFCLSPDI